MVKQRIGGPEKAAILLTDLGAIARAFVFWFLEKKDVERITLEIKRLPKKVEPWKRQEVIKETKSLLAAQELKPKEKPTRDIRDYGILGLLEIKNGAFFETFSQ